MSGGSGATGHRLRHAAAESINEFVVGVCLKEPHGVLNVTKDLDDKVEHVSEKPHIVLCDADHESKANVVPSPGDGRVAMRDGDKRTFRVDRNRVWHGKAIGECCGGNSFAKMDVCNIVGIDIASGDCGSTELVDAGCGVRRVDVATIELRLNQMTQQRARIVVAMLFLDAGQPVAHLAQVLLGEDGSDRIFSHPAGTVTSMVVMTASHSGGSER